MKIPQLPKPQVTWQLLGGFVFIIIRFRAQRIDAGGEMVIT